MYCAVCCRLFVDPRWPLPRNAMGDQITIDNLPKLALEFYTRKLTHITNANGTRMGIIAETVINGTYVCRYHGRKVDLDYLNNATYPNESL